MIRTIQILLLTVSLLIGIQPLSAGITLIVEQPAVTATVNVQGVAPSTFHEYYDHQYHTENDYDCTHHNSAVVLALSSTTTELASDQTTSSGHALQSTLSI